MCFVDLVFARRQSTLLGASCSHPSRAGLLVTLLLLEVLVGRLIDFFVSGSAIAQQSLVTSALVASAPLLCLPEFLAMETYCVVLCVVVMSHPQPSLSGTGVLWVSTGTHRCVDPAQAGRWINNAPARAVCGFWLPCTVRSSSSNTPPRLKHACRRGFRRLVAPRDTSIYHTFMFSCTSLRSSCS